MRLTRNKISEIKGLDGLTNLENLVLTDNQITEINDFKYFLGNSNSLKSLSLNNNPVPEEELDKLGGRRRRKSIVFPYY